MAKTLCLGIVLLLTACAAVGPDYEKPDRSMPATYHAPLAKSLKALPQEISNWWHQLGDPILNDLIADTARENLDLKQAWSRLREARYRRVIAGAGNLPNMDFSTDYKRLQNSGESPAGSFLDRESHSFETGLSAEWEIDLWGRIARSVESSDALVDASLEDYRDALTTMVAETAINYVELRSFQERLRIARSNLELQAQTLEISKVRFRSGLVSQLDVAQARTLLESTRATLPTLVSGVDAAANRLAVLTGATPGSLQEQLKTIKAVPIAGLEVAVGVPADLLRRRADIRRAERQLAAQTARIGLAEAELYPKLSLLGTLGLSSDDFVKHFTRSATSFGIGPSLSFNIFDRSRLKAAVQIETARQEQSFLHYEQSILLALEEVENAMVRFVNEQLRRESLQQAVTESRRALNLAREQYKEGLVDFQSVLESQRSLFSLEDQLTVNHTAITTAMISLYKALGGGWEHFEMNKQDLTSETEKN